MSEHILKILLSELSTIRIRCKKCRTHGTLEMPVARLDRIGEYRCPMCLEPFWKDQADKNNHLIGLQEAIEGLAEDADRIEVEFVIPAPTTQRAQGNDVARVPS